ncbi:Arrestin domain-containing B [Gossypium arboreum]|uniref:Arrestin domain-containing B n=1 Tax=Gossypium arboreum TaxID=29729 RepID=A0A0B0PS22_GOSAR|nr:Arrestin domain-containing B [Gossypium arboreum]
MPCPRHGLTLTIEFKADAMFQTWSYTSSHISMPMPCPKHCFTLTPLYVLMPCPIHGVTLTRPVADACPRHVLHWLTSRGQCMS